MSEPPPPSPSSLLAAATRNRQSDQLAYVCISERLLLVLVLLLCRFGDLYIVDSMRTVSGRRPRHASRTRAGAIVGQLIVGELSGFDGAILINYSALRHCNNVSIIIHTSIPCTIQFECSHRIYAVFPLTRHAIQLRRKWRQRTCLVGHATSSCGRGPGRGPRSCRQVRHATALRKSLSDAEAKSR